MNCSVFAYRQNHYGNDLSRVTGTLPEIISDALNVWSRDYPNETAIRAALLNTLGEIQVKEGELGAKEKFAEAEKNFEEAIRIALENQNKEEISIYKGNLANFLLKQKDWQKAIGLASDSLRLAEELGSQEEIARENLHLAIAYLNLGDGKPRGLKASQKAVEIYRRLRHKALPDAKAILMEWKNEL